jgi:hypothetical protein
LYYFRFFGLMTLFFIGALAGTPSSLPPRDVPEGM